MVESKNELPSEYEWLYDLRTGVGVSCPAGWFYHTAQNEDNATVCCLEVPHSHEEVDFITTGFAMNVYPPHSFKIANTQTGYRKFTGKLPRMFQDMDAVGILSDIEENGRFISRYQDFHADEAIYVIEKSDNAEDLFQMPERLFKVRLIIDTSKGTIYFARFVLPASEPEKMAIAEKVFSSIEIS